MPNNIIGSKNFSINTNLIFLIFHKGNKMDYRNMSIVIGPNISPSSEQYSNHAELLAETEMAQRLVEILIIFVNDVFENTRQRSMSMENTPLLV